MGYGPGFVQLFPLFDNLTLRSPGGGTGWSYLYLPVERLGAILPYASALRVHYMCRNQSAACEWKVVFWSSYDGSDWAGPYDLHTAVTADGQGVSGGYSTVANFLRHARFGVGVRAASGTAQEGAVASATLEATWKN